MRITSVVGDATRPVGTGPCVITHVCNDLGRWGKGFVLALSDAWPEAERRYRRWYAGETTDGPFALGRAQFVCVDPNIWIANVIGQHGITRRNGVPPVRYDAIESGLSAVADFALARSASVHMPRIGCGLAGGTWDVVGPIVQRQLGDRGVTVTVYDLGPTPVRGR